MADVSKSYFADSYDIQEGGGMYLRDVYIQGAEWDTDKNCSTHSRYPEIIVLGSFVIPVRVNTQCCIRFKILE